MRAARVATRERRDRRAVPGWEMGEGRGGFIGGGGLETERLTDLGAVDSLMTTGTPAGAAGEEGGMVEGADHDATGGGLLLEVAFEAEHGIAGGEHLLVDRAMGLVAGEATFADGFMFEDVGTALGGVTGEATFVDGGEGGAAGLEGVAAVGVMAGAAAEAAISDAVAMGQAEFGAQVGVALEAGFGVAIGMDQGAGGAAGFDMGTGGSVAGFATDIDLQGALGDEAGVGGGAEMAGDAFVALFAGIGTDVGGAGELVGKDHGATGPAAGGGAGEGDQCEPSAEEGKREAAAMLVAPATQAREGAKNGAHGSLEGRVQGSAWYQLGCWQEGRAAPKLFDDEHSLARVWVACLEPWTGVG